MQFLGILILWVFSISSANAQQSDSLSTNIGNYYKFNENSVLDSFKPLTRAQDFLKVLENRKLVDIDAKARYVYLYCVGTGKGTTKLTGEILNTELYKKRIMDGMEFLKNYTCSYGICSSSTSDACGTDQWLSYEGGIIVWVNSCGAMHMYLDIAQGLKPRSSEAAVSTTDEHVERPNESEKVTPVPIPDPGRFD